VLRKSLGVFLLLLLPLWAAGQDKSKKTYELIYDDVQFLKQQVQEILARTERNAEDILALSGQVKSLGDLVRQAMSDQARLREDVRGIPAQYRDLLVKIDQISLGLQKISADLGALKGTSAPPAGEEKPAESPPAEGAAEKPPAAKPEEKAAATTPPPPPPSNISPQEAYAMAYNDYLQGNFDLAIESFKLYKQQFPTSPLADNSLYWVGECHFSQRRFQEAIDTFDELILTYPNGDKAAAAYLKKGMSFQELKKDDEALAVYRILVTKFPLEEETKIAQAKIKELTDK
jgi:tol-pal system protein YbgF